MCSIIVESGQFSWAEFVVEVLFYMCQCYSIINQRVTCVVHSPLCSLVFLFCLSIFSLNLFIQYFVDRRSYYSFKYVSCLINRTCIFYILSCLNDIQDMNCLTMQLLILNVSNNKLKSLPESIGSCFSLEELQANGRFNISFFLNCFYQFLLTFFC